MDEGGEGEGEEERSEIGGMEVGTSLCVCVGVCVYGVEITKRTACIAGVRSAVCRGFICEQRSVVHPPLLPPHTYRRPPPIWSISECYGSINYGLV